MSKQTSQRKNLFLVLTGPSGSGKSTTIKALFSKDLGKKLWMPMRYTTRPCRPSDNTLEVQHASYDDFISGIVSKNIAIPHKIRDKWNGLWLPDNNPEVEENTVLIQALQTSAGVKLRSEFKHKFDILICRLKASEKTVLTRLSQRDPDSSKLLQEASQRAKLTPKGNDLELNAELTPNEIALHLKKLIENYLKSSSLNYAMNNVDKEFFTVL